MCNERLNMERPILAQGGIVINPRLAMFGDPHDEPEFIIPLSKTDCNIQINGTIDDKMVAAMKESFMKSLL